MTITLASYGAPCDSVPMWAEDVKAARRVGHHLRDCKEGDKVRRDVRDEMRAMAEAREKALKRAEEILERDELDPKLVEAARAKVWAIPSHPEAKDWGMEPRADGVCRHKAEWLKVHFGGGDVVSGWRTDRDGGTYHACFAFRWFGREYVADFDKVWHAERHPFIRADAIAATKWRKQHERWLKYGRKDEKRDEIEKRIRELEQREHDVALKATGTRDQSLNYKGVWDRGQNYYAGQFVTDKGALWHAEIDSRGCRPGEGFMWKLAVKAPRYKSRNAKSDTEREIDAAWEQHNARRGDDDA